MKRRAVTFNVNDLSTWRLPVALLIGLFIVGSLFYMSKTFITDNVSHAVRQKNVEITNIEQQYKNNRNIIANLVQIRREVEELQKIRDEAIKFLPTDISMPELIDNVYDSARKNDIVFSSFMPQPDINTAYYTIKPISLSANVGYLSMADFIEEVTTLKRIMNVHSVSFSAASNFSSESVENAPLQMTAQLRTYIFKE